MHTFSTINLSKSMPVLIMLWVLPTTVTLLFHHLFRADEISFTPLHDTMKCSKVSSQLQISQFGLSVIFALKSQCCSFVQYFLLKRDEHCCNYYIGDNIFGRVFAALSVMSIKPHQICHVLFGIQ